MIKLIRTLYSLQLVDHLGIMTPESKSPREILVCCSGESISMLTAKNST